MNYYTTWCIYELKNYSNMHKCLLYTFTDSLFLMKLCLQNACSSTPSKLQLYANCYNAYVCTRAIFAAILNIFS